MTDFHVLKEETQLLHGGQEPDPTTGSRAMPIYQTTSYVFRDTEHAQNLFGLTEPGNIYSRIMNPTLDAFEKRVALLEDGVAAVATSSGMAAISLTILNLAESGDEIIADSNLYGGSYNLFANTLPRYGITVKLVDGTDHDSIKNAITDKTKAIFGEIITNPSLNVLDIEGIAGIAHAHDIPLIIDNTFATPYVSKPLTWGADIVIHSATKWIGGHGTAIAGVVVDGGRFNWDNGKFPGFTEPDESYNGLKYADVGPDAFATKLRVQLLRDIGACLSPQNAFLLLQGLETLHLRMERHQQNAKQVAEYLNNHPAVEWVNFPGFKNHPSHDLANKYLKIGYGSIITFGIQGGREAGRQLIDNVSLWSHVANVGDAKSLIIHPASTTQQQLTPEELKENGTTEGLIRLSIGLETVNDIIMDLDQAISQATGASLTIVSAEEDAIHWLLSSPFDRSNGDIRQKNIVVFDLNSKNHPNYQSAKQLETFGFNVISINSSGEQSEAKQTVASISEAPAPIDAVIYNGGDLSPEAMEQLSEKENIILWGEDAIGDHTEKDAQNLGITSISNKSAYQEALRIRQNGR